MLLLWKNNIPMSIEVVLCPDCSHGSTMAQSLEACPAPEPSYELLEQWIIQMTPRRFSDEGRVPGKSLLQVVRSFLHFSQVSAWLSSSNGKFPQNVMYRICVPGEAFSNKFSKLPNDHTFPIANVGRNNSMKVIVKHLPRCDSVPRVSCRRRHEELDEPCCSHASTSWMDVAGTSSTAEQSKMNAACALSSSPPSISERRSREDLRRRVAANIQSRRDHRRQGDSTLGDCLLDPPQSLDMYPKRYQSPSRSGSPVMETPEHLMFGGHSRMGESSRISSNWNNPPPEIRERKLSPPSTTSAPVNPKKGSAACFEVPSDTDDDDEVLDYPLLDEGGPVKETNQTKGTGVKCKPGEFPKNSCSNYFNLDDKRTKDINSPSNANIYFALTPKETEEILSVLRQTTPSWASCSSRNSKTSSPRKRRNDYGESNLPSTSTGSQINPEPPSDTMKSSDILPESQENEEKNGDHKNNNINDICDTNNLNIRGYNNCQNNSSSSSSNTYEDATSVVDYVENAAGSPSSALNVSMMSLDDEESSCEYEMELDKLILENGEVDWEEWKKISLMGDPESSYRILQQLLSKNSHTHSKVLSSKAKDAILKLVPSLKDKVQFRRSLDSATSMVFHTRTGLPLTSSPAPIRRGTRFDFDSSLTSVAAIKKALFVSNLQREEGEGPPLLSSSAPAATCGLLGNFEESVLNGRIEPVSTVEGFAAEIGASGSFLTKHLTLPVTVFFYTFSDNDKVSSPYLGHINLGKKKFYVPPSGTIQVTLFNPHLTVVKMFVVRYDLSNIPPNCQTFLRQRTLFMPVGADENSIESQKWLRYLIHLRLASSKSGRLFLHTDVRMVIYRQSDVDAATSLSKGAYELRSFTHGPQNPPYSSIR